MEAAIPGAWGDDRNRIAKETVVTWEDLEASDVGTASAFREPTLPVYRTAIKKGEPRGPPLYFDC